MTDNNNELMTELQTLKNEVMQLKEMVNMLVDIVVDMDGGEDEEFGVDFELPFPGKGSKTSFCM